MRRALLLVVIVGAAATFLVLGTGASSNSAAGTTYKIQFDNAFGLVPGADFKVAGVKAGKIQSIDLDQRTLHAVVTVQVTVGGYGQFRSDVFCQSRPQTLIGEYFVECQPGQYGRVLRSGSTIPVTHTQSTIPGDLLQNVMRLPYRQRFTIIINELGAAVAGRSEDLSAALRRAVPALTETDNLLNLLAGDSNQLKSLTTASDTVVTALADNKQKVQQFIDEANRASVLTAAQQGNLRRSLQLLPPFLEELKPSLAQLSLAIDANTPVLQNLNATAGELNQLLVDLPPFSKSAQVAIKSLGQASVTGKQAVIAATPTVKDLNAFAQPTPELAKNLSIILNDLNDRSRAVEPDSRSPGGKGYTGLEAVLQYVFNQALAINTYGPFGHLLAVDLFADPECSPYATPPTIALALAKYGPSYRHCYSWLGPNQPGVTTQDPSNPTACIPDPGGAPPGSTGLSGVTQCKLTAAAVQAGQTAKDHAAADTGSATPVSTAARGATAASGSGGGRGSGGSGTATSTSGGSSGSSAASSSLASALGLSNVGGSTPSGSSTSGKSTNQTQQLLNYLLAP